MPSRLSQRIEFAVHASANPKTCWEVFTDWQNWNMFVPGTYKTIEWTKGEPWTIGSRVQMEIMRPVEFSTECVIIGSSPPSKIGWIHHEMENMVEQWVSFLPDGSAGGTDISVWMEINGRTLEVAGRNVIEVIREFKQDWYRRLARRCEELVLEQKDCRRA
jgi:hypothetical protein